MLNDSFDDHFNTASHIVQVIKAQLTHYSDLERSSSGVAFGVLGDASVRSLIGISLDVLDDQRSVGEYLLLAVDGQLSVV